MRVLIFGGSGMLGHKLVQVLNTRFEVFTTVRGASAAFENFDILPAERIFGRVSADDFSTVLEVLAVVRPDVIINAIGIIKQIPTSKDVVETLKVNSIFPHQIAEIAKKIGARFITISTDCVFDGKTGFYTEEDKSNAADLYGRSKSLGEVTDANCLTIRTSIIGREVGTSHSLVEWFLSNRGGKIKGFKKAIYTGFPTIVLADIIGDLIENHPSLQGLYHVSSDPISKFDLLNLIKMEMNLDVEIEPDTEFQIDRSLDSTKFRQATGFQTPDWDEMIKKLFGDPTPYEKWSK